MAYRSMASMRIFCSSRRWMEKDAESGRCRYHSSVRSTRNRSPPHSRCARKNSKSSGEPGVSQ